MPLDAFAGCRDAFHSDLCVPVQAHCQAREEARYLVSSTWHRGWCGEAPREWSRGAGEKDSPHPGPLPAGEGIERPGMAMPRALRLSLMPSASVRLVLANCEEDPVLTRGARFWVPRCLSLVPSAKCQVPRCFLFWRTAEKTPCFAWGSDQGRGSFVWAEMQPLADTRGSFERAGRPCHWWGITP